jgi:malate synthase
MTENEALGEMEAFQLLAQRDAAVEALEGLLDALKRMRRHGTRASWVATARAIKEIDIHPRTGRDRLLLLASDARCEIDSLLEFVEGES